MGKVRCYSQCAPTSLPNIRLGYKYMPETPRGKKFNKTVNVLSWYVTSCKEPLKVEQYSQVFILYSQNTLVNRHLTLY